MSKYFPISALSFVLLFGVACDSSDGNDDTDSGQPDSGTSSDAGHDAAVDPCIGEDGCRACQVDGDNLSYLNRCGDPRVQCQAYDGVIPAPPP